MGMHRYGLKNIINATDEKPRITWDLIKRVLAYAKPYRLRLIFLLVIILITTGLSLVSPLILRDLVDHAIPDKNVSRLVFLAVAILLVELLGGVFQIIQRVQSSKVGEGVIFDLRVDLYAKLQRMSLRFFTHTKVGELMSRLNSDVVGAQTAISNTLVGIITNTFRVVAIVVVLFSLEWRLTLISIVIMPLFLLATRLLGGKLRDIARKQMDANAQMNALMNETLNIGGSLLVKLFSRSSLEVARFSKKAAQVRDTGVQRTLYGASFIAIVGLISATGTALVYGLGGYFVIQDLFTIGTIVAFGAYLANLYVSMQGLANAPAEFATSMVSFERVFEIVDLPEEINELKNAIELERTAGNLEFRQVHFKYDTDQEPTLKDVNRYGSMDSVRAVLSETLPEEQQVLEGEPEAAPLTQARTLALEDIDFEVKSGQLVALVGPSGAGKTTLTYLIPRLYDPSQGAIYLDGHDLRTLTLDSLAQQIGMVTQETYLFHDTIRTNLLYAKLDATQEELEAACRVANIHEYISALPDGYNTIVGERGYRLSGGEKQRLALARVILKNPQILILDEATSSLDSESEALIQDALTKVLKQRTSIVIAHRLSTILSADLILVMDRGRIVEKGTHEELMSVDGLYSTLYDTQFHKVALTDPLTPG